MRGAIYPLLQYVAMAWCLVKHNFTLYKFIRYIQNRILVKKYSILNEVFRGSPQSLLKAPVYTWKEAKTASS
jgi:hypothetical protein